MCRALSMDLRERVLKAWRCGLSARRAADRFGVSASTAIRWAERSRQGEREPRKPHFIEAGWCLISPVDC